jgi:hypothetical protein
MSSPATKKAPTGRLQSSDAVVGRDGFEPSIKRLKISTNHLYFQSLRRDFVPQKAGEMPPEALLAQGRRENCGTI